MLQVRQDRSERSVYIDVSLSFIIVFFLIFIFSSFFFFLAASTIVFNLFSKQVALAACFTISQTLAQSNLLNHIN